MMAANGGGLREQVNGYLGALRQALGANLAGVYLHGSLAMGCFNPARSDIDLLVVTHEGMAASMKRAMFTLLLERSGRPHPIEVSFLTMAGLHPWRHPAPYDLHWSESHRHEVAARLAHPDWESWVMRDLVDRDLAAHVAMIRERGLTLAGAPIPEVFGEVEPAHFRDALWYDLAGAPARIADEPVYLTLNLARALAYLQEGQLLSKAEGGAWALTALPPQFAGLLRQALACYGGAPLQEGFDSGELRAYATYVDGLIREAPGV